MSKYVRIKDAILEKHTFTLNDTKYIGDPYSGILCEEEDIIKEADTIEELCDGVLVEEKDNPNHWFIMETDEFTETPKDEMMIKNWTYRAFIKTDKGLIYVAKMNEEGELELI